VTITDSRCRCQEPPVYADHWLNGRGDRYSRVLARPAMRDFLLSVLLALPGAPVGAHVCGNGTHPDREQVHAEASTEPADAVTCHGHDDEAATVGIDTPSTLESTTAPDKQRATDDGSGDCCGSGSCECPCATLAALPPALAPLERVKAPDGPAAIRVIAPPLAASGPPLRPPIA
jgi:hypothetical protein